MSSRSVCTQRVALCRRTAATPRLRCHLVWIKIHTPAVAWNLFHAEATRVGPRERPRLGDPGHPLSDIQGAGSPRQFGR